MDEIKLEKDKMRFGMGKKREIWSFKCTFSRIRRRIVCIALRRFQLKIDVGYDIIKEGNHSVKLL